MLSILIYFLIYAGVSVAVYQLYDVYHHQNFADEEKRAREGTQALENLAQQAEAYRHTGEATGFIQGVKALFGRDFDPRVAMAAFLRTAQAGASGKDASQNGASQGQALPNVEPLLRRKHNIVCNGSIRIRHPLGITTPPPSKDSRGVSIALIIINCLLALFLGGLSVYAIGYAVPAAWMQDASLLMLAIYALLLFTHLIAKLDNYLNDLYQIGRLNRHLPAQPLDGTRQASARPA